MDVNFEERDGAFVAKINGRIDTTNYNEFEAKTLEMLRSNEKLLILDCENLSYISSSGLRVFLMLQKKVMSSGRVLKLCSMQPVIKEIFDISGFSSIFVIIDKF